MVFLPTLFIVNNAVQIVQIVNHIVSKVNLKNYIKGSCQNKVGYALIVGGADRIKHLFLFFFFAFYLGGGDFTPYWKKWRGNFPAVFENLGLEGMYIKVAENGAKCRQFGIPTSLKCKLKDIVFSPGTVKVAAAKVTPILVLFCVNFLFPLATR